MWYYGIEERFGAYLVYKLSETGYRYLVRCRKGVYTWTRDYLYAKRFCLATAQKHARNLLYGKGEFQ